MAVVRKIMQPLFLLSHFFRKAQFDYRCDVIGGGCVILFNDSLRDFVWGEVA